jgi:hypothetical protein
MKKMAARDFEDLLQVCSAFFDSAFVLTGVVSAQFLFLMAFSPNHTTPPFCNYSLFAHIGMVWLNFACILTPPSTFLTA